MPEVLNLKSKIENALPAELASLMKAAGKLACEQGQGLYLVGGVVRDLMLGQKNFDLDLVVEGDAIRLAEKLSKIKKGKLSIYPHFGTAKLEWKEWSVDLATARSETYAKPGALPSTKPSTLAQDLSRRDFTINTMAIHLDPSRFGELIDLHSGRDDLENKIIRVLHERSFIDDATRIWRGIRYEKRLDFRLEENTLKLLKQDIPMLDTISDDRIRYELECVFKEESPEKALRRAEELGVLAKLHPALRATSWLAQKFKAARKFSHPDLPSFELYLAILTYPLTSKEKEELISYLNLPKSIAKTLRDSTNIKSELVALAKAELKPSRIYRILHGYAPAAVQANLLATDSQLAGENIQLFLNKLRYVKPALSGKDLIRTGIPSGPRIKEILEQLLEARLDGKVTTRKDEEDLVKRWLVGRR